MSYTKTAWADRIDSGNKYSITDNGDGTSRIEYAGTVAQEGTPVNAENLNHMEQGIYEAHENKVDKETGKGLSSNDYTTAEKNKLAGLSNYDDTAVNNAMVRADAPDEEGFSQLFKTVNGQRVDIDPKTSGGGSAAPYTYMTVDDYISLTPEEDVLYWVINDDGEHGVYKNSRLVEGENAFKSYSAIQSLVRNGTFANYYSVGDQLTVKYNGNDTLWDIVAIDVATPADASKTHSVTLMPHECLEKLMFDNAELNNSDTNRRNYGNNRYLHSNIRQWLNSSAAAGSWYTNQHGADAAPDYANTKPGFMSYFDSEFLAVVGKTKIKTVKNTVTDGGGYEEMADEYFYLPSTTEVGLANENNIAEGVLFPYFSSDTKRIKNYGGSTTIWWLRTPYSGYSCYVRNVNTSGALRDNYAYGSSGVAPACNII